MSVSPAPERASGPKTNRRWITVNVEVVTETPKAVLVDFGADKGCTHQAWVPKSHFQQVTQGAFVIDQITAQWLSMKQLWKWL